MSARPNPHKVYAQLIKMPIPSICSSYPVHVQDCHTCQSQHTSTLIHINAGIKEHGIKIQYNALLLITFCIEILRWSPLLIHSFPVITPADDYSYNTAFQAQIGLCFEQSGLEGNVPACGRGTGTR